MANDILIVDDEADIRDLVAGILDDEGYKTRTARDSGRPRPRPIRACIGRSSPIGAGTAGTGPSRRPSGRFHGAPV